jgi:hypothetical protein
MAVASLAKTSVALEEVGFGGSIVKAHATIERYPTMAEVSASKLPSILLFFYSSHLLEDEMVTHAALSFRWRAVRACADTHRIAGDDQE